MDNQIVQRRMSMIACHLGGSEEVKGNHLFPMNCSGTISSVMQRRDNRVLFARQGSAFQACFMRQVSNKEDNCCEPPAFARPVQKSAYFPKFIECQAIDNFDSVASEPPRFSRPATALTSFQSFNLGFHFFMLTPPISDTAQEWSPRMDVAECASHYTVTVELPGVTSKNIRVEMDEQNLVVSGRRLNIWGHSGSRDPTVTYHRKEISQGPYQIVWVLPNNVNKDRVSAEFVDGFLRIMLPKV
ncbi:Small heat shock protein C4 [Nymphaea thermarum]|nr:Small heat shock protein C4 [Nymphaea thermarum]